MAEIDRFHEHRLNLIATGPRPTVSNAVIEELRKRLFDRLGLSEIAADAKDAAEVLRDKKYSEMLKKKYGSERAAAEIIEAGLKNHQQQQSRPQRSFGKKTVL